MSSAGYLVSTDSLNYHATRVRSVADDVARAADAARQIDLDDGAFGLLCSFLPGFVNGAETETGNAVRAAAETLEAMVVGIRAMANTYGTTDESVATTLQRLMPQ